MAEVVRLEWPEPSELVEARRCLSDGDAAGALAALVVVRRQFAPFARVPGSWWTAASRLQLQALDREASPEDVARLAREISALASDPEAVGEARLALTELEIRSGRVQLAQAMLEEVLAGPVSAAIRARAWLLRGDIALAGRRFEQAIEAYLRIPVFHSAYADLIPPALAAAEKAFRAYGDDAQADRVSAERARIEAASRPGPATSPDTSDDLSTEP
jgi:tetratricopeptide (TPR) repeat protein